MNKKLLAAAVGATLAMAPVLSAQAAKVKVYGKAQVELVNIDSDAGASYDGTEQGDKNGRSRWGVKASESLGNGMKAFAVMEFNMSKNMSGASGGDSDRVMKVGLKGGFGTLSFGRDHGAYKLAGGVKWDPYAATFMQARRNGGMSGGGFGHNSFQNDTIGYKTPKMGGFSANIQVSLDESSNDGDYHVAVKWKNGPLAVIGAINHDDSKDADNAKIGARYKSGGLTAAFQYESVENGGDIRVNGHKTGDKTTDGSFLWVNLGYKFGSNVVSGSIGSFDADSGSDTDYFAIGLTHFFSKKTRAYVGYTSVDSVKDDVGMFGGGIRFDF